MPAELDEAGMPRDRSGANLFQSGVIDPAKVCRVALENAASIAGMLLTTECVLCDIKEPVLWRRLCRQPPMPAGNPGMGGMGGMY